MYTDRLIRLTLQPLTRAFVLTKEWLEAVEARLVMFLHTIVSTLLHGTRNTGVTDLQPLLFFLRQHTLHDHFGLNGHASEPLKA